MTDRQILLIKTTWSYIMARSQEAGEIFYNRFFAMAPEFRAMFKGDIKEQGQKLIAMGTTIISRIQQMDDILQEVKGLAVRHVEYQVKPEHYQIMREALLWTLERGLRNNWTRDVHDAWDTVYQMIANTMIEAANEYQQGANSTNNQ